MLATLTAALVLIPVPVFETYELIPTDDVWVYPHASDPSQDPYLRVWGGEGKSVEEPGHAPDVHSYSYLRFDLSPLPKSFKVLEASLTLYHVASPGWSAAVSKEAPLEARALVGDFDEKTWAFERSAKVHPDPSKDALFGSTSPEPGPEGKEVAIKVILVSPPAPTHSRDRSFAALLKESKIQNPKSKTDSPFEAALFKALSSEKPFLSLALCSKIDPFEVGNGGVYKVYSKDGPKEFRPILRILAGRVQARAAEIGACGSSN